MRLGRLAFMQLLSILALAGPVQAADSCRTLFEVPILYDLNAIDPYITPHNERVGRTEIRYDEGVPIIVLHYSFQRSDFENLEIVREVRKLGGTVVNEGALSSREYDPSVNCHGYACLVSNVPGLHDGWIHPVADDVTDHTNPLASILDRFFDRVKTFDATAAGAIETNSDLREGDLITLIDQGFNVHSGVLVKTYTTQGPRLWVRSKIGRSITADLPLTTLKSVWYDFTRIEIWRRQ